MAYQPRFGDYGVVKTGGWAAKLIQIGTISRWNHTFIYIGGGEIVEARPTGVVISKTDQYPNIAWNQHEVMDDITRNVIVDKAKSFVGQPYGFLAIGNIALRILGLRALANYRILERMAASEGLICSELVSLAYKAGGVDLTGNPDYRVTPGDLAERLIYQ
jgi:uncharacterized protein YycO